jgi:hypothetical protein
VSRAADYLGTRRKKKPRQCVTGASLPERPRPQPGSGSAKGTRFVGGEASDRTSCVKLNVDLDQTFRLPRSPFPRSWARSIAGQVLAVSPFLPGLEWACRIARVALARGFISFRRCVRRARKPLAENQYRKRSRILALHFSLLRFLGENTHIVHQGCVWRRANSE